MINKMIRCAITTGDPSGIGPETVVKALNSRQLRGAAEFTVITDRCVLNKYRSVEALKRRNISFLYMNNVPRKGFRFGRVRAEYGRAALEYLDKAIGLLKNKEIDCLVTAPMNKEAVNLAGYKFSGHTEYIARAFKAKDARMMLFNKRLRVALVTQHIPLKEAVKKIHSQDIFKTIVICAKGLKSLFGLKGPQIAVCGLNPHASDNGTIGNEEKEIILPAVKKALRLGIAAYGPYPADTIFNKALSGAWDCVICMYHDQGMIPLKLTGFRDAVNLTLGLPFIRTSPGHGTAFDIAGENKADPSSFIQAVKTAIQCARNLKRD